MATLVTEENTEARPAGAATTSKPFDRTRAGVIPHMPVSSITKRNTGIAVLPLLWRRFVLFFVGVAAIFTTIETALSLTDDRVHGPGPEHSYQPVPYVETYQKPNYHSQGIVTNDAGFRYGPLPVNKPPEEVRIFFLSSSVGYLGTTNETTIAGRMEAQLASYARISGCRIRVVNASGISFGTTQSLVLLVTRVLAYHPDIVVLFQGSEALFYPTRYESRPGYPFNFTVREYLNDKLTGKIDQPNPVIKLLMQTRTMQRFHPTLARNALQSKLSLRNNLITIDALEEYDPYIDVVVDDVTKMARIAGAYDCRMLVAVPPVRRGVLLPGARARLTYRVRQAVESQTETSVHYVALGNVDAQIHARHLWQHDGIHWKDEGNRLVANCLLRALFETKLLQK